MTFLEMRDEVEATVIDVPARTRALIPQYINSALRTLQVRRVFHVMETRIDVNTVVGQRELVVVPENFRSLLGEAVAINDLGGWKPVHIAPSAHEVLRRWGPLSEGSPDTLVIANDPSDELGGSVVQIYPLPDGRSDYQDGEYRLQIPYARYLAPLVDDGDRNWLTIYGHRFIVYTAVSLAFLANENYDRADVWRAEANRHFNEIKQADTARRIAHVDVLVPHGGGYAPRYQR